MVEEKVELGANSGTAHAKIISFACSVFSLHNCKRKENIFVSVQISSEKQISSEEQVNRAYISLMYLTRSTPTERQIKMDKC